MYIGGGGRASVSAIRWESTMGEKGQIIFAIVTNACIVVGRGKKSQLMDPRIWLTSREGDEEGKVRRKQKG